MSFLELVSEMASVFSFIFTHFCILSFSQGGCYSLAIQNCIYRGSVLGMIENFDLTPVPPMTYR